MTVPGSPQRALVIGEALIDIVEREGQVTGVSMSAAVHSTWRSAWRGWAAASTSSPT